jgi:hypothetical protein
MRTLSAIFLGVATITSTACMHVTVESAWQDNGLRTATFDLQCPAEKIEISVLNRNDGLGCLGSKVGARGCGKQTQYECDNARSWHRSGEISKIDVK